MKQSASTMQGVVVSMPLPPEPKFSACCMNLNLSVTSESLTGVSPAEPYHRWSSLHVLLYQRPKLSISK